MKLIWGTIIGSIWLQKNCLDLNLFLVLMSGSSSLNGSALLGKFKPATVIMESVPGSSWKNELYGCQWHMVEIYQNVALKEDQTLLSQ
jgi:hypothetical protein